MNIPRATKYTGDFVIYGGTRGIGLLMSEKLALLGLQVFAVGRSTPNKINQNINFVSIDFSGPSGFSSNRNFLRTRPALKCFIFNIGGSFGIHDTHPAFNDFQMLVNLNIAYIIDTVNFLESTGRLRDCLLVFILSNAIHNGRGNLPYRILKIALDEYARELDSVNRKDGVHVLRFYPPLILYPDRYMARKFLSISSEFDKRCFIEEELCGVPPVGPSPLVEEIISTILGDLQL